MRTLQVRFVRNHILIDFEQSDLFRTLSDSNGIQRQHSRLNTKEIYGKRRYEPGTRLTAKPIWADDSFSLQFLDALEEKLVWLASLVNRLVKPNFLPKSMFTFLVKRIWTKPAYACFLNSGFV
jgi:hypothetical protein